MLAKIVFLIVSMAAIACALLAIRQSRLQTASEIVQAQVRINAMDERLAALRIAVAERVAPDQVRAMAADITDLVPLAQAAGDVAREKLLREQEAANTPTGDTASLHNPDGTPRTQEPATTPDKPAKKSTPPSGTKPKSKTKTKSTRSGGAA